MPDPPSERPPASAGSGDDGDGGDGLGESVSRFGVDVAELSEAELERRAEAYLAEQERRYKERAEAYLGFDRGDAVDGDGDRREVDRGGD